MKLGASTCEENACIDFSTHRGRLLLCFIPDGTNQGEAQKPVLDSGALYRFRKLCWTGYKTTREHRKAHRLMQCASRQVV
jgi:hypothetical protein